MLKKFNNFCDSLEHKYPILYIGSVSIIGGILISIPIAYMMFYFAAPCSFDRENTQECIETIKDNRQRKIKEIEKLEGHIVIIDKALKGR